MNVVKNLTVTALGARLVIGCGKTTSDVVNTVKEPGLMKTWSLGCDKAEILDVSAKSYYQFSGKDLTKAYELYTDNGCSRAAVLIKQEGTFDLRGNDTRTADAKAIDFHFRKVVVTAKDPEGQKLLEKVGFCDHNSWPVGQAIEVTNNLGSLKCPLPKLHDEYDIYKVQDDSLTLGEGKFFGRAESADKRPSKLATDKVYHPENRSF